MMEAAAQEVDAVTQIVLPPEALPDQRHMRLAVIGEKIFNQFLISKYHY